MKRHPNVDLAEDAWLAVSNSDVEALEKLWAEDIVWHATGPSPWTGVYVGRNAVLDYLARVGEAGEAYDIRLDDVLVSDAHMTLLCHVQLRNGNREIQADQALLGRVEDGKIAEVWVLPLEPQALEAYWDKVAEEKTEP